MLASWCVLVACVGAAVSAPQGVSVQVGPGGVDVGLGGHKLVDVDFGGGRAGGGVGGGQQHTRTLGKTVDVNVGGLVDVEVEGHHQHSSSHSFRKPVDVNVGGGLVDVQVGGGHQHHSTSVSKPVDVNVGGGLVDVQVGGGHQHSSSSSFRKPVDVNVGGGLVDVEVEGHHQTRTFTKKVDVDVGAGGVDVDVEVPHRSTSSFSKPVEVDVGAGGVNVDVGAGGVNVDVGRPQDTHRTQFTKVVDVNVGSHPHHHHGHHVFKTHTIDPNFRNTETFTALDNAGSNLFKGLGNAATALGDFLSSILGGRRS